MGEGVVGRASVDMLGQQSDRHCGGQRFGERVHVRRFSTQVPLDFDKIAQAEVAPEHGRLRQRSLGRVREARRASLDQRPYCRRQ
jgi:hypothetical protein